MPFMKAVLYQEGKILGTTPILEQAENAAKGYAKRYGKYVYMVEQHSDRKPLITAFRPDGSSGFVSKVGQYIRKPRNNRYENYEKDDDGNWTFYTRELSPVNGHPISKMAKLDKKTGKIKPETLGYYVFDSFGGSFFDTKTLKEAQRIAREWNE